MTGGGLAEIWKFSEFSDFWCLYVCMVVTQKVLEHLSRAPQYYLPPDSNIYFHYQAATNAATTEAFGKPVEASRSFKNVLEQRDNGNWQLFSGLPLEWFY